jgi:N6-adenosine-specific RNA methylase IME4
MGDLLDLSGSQALVVYAGDDRSNQAISIDVLARALADARTPEDVLPIEKQLDLAERYMRESGLYNAAQIHEVNELRMRARWRLGQLLAAVDRGTAGRPPADGNSGTRSHYFMALLERLHLQHKTARLAQRIGALPEDELEKALAAAQKQGDGFFASFAYLLDRARPYWYAASRQSKHQLIHANAMSAVTDDRLGPFPLIYADPPWKFEIYSPKGLERTPDQHYPTLTDDEIANFKIGDRTIPEIAHADSALFLWCTSSNVARALWIMAAWGFEFKTCAVWVKDKAGMGLVFRSRFELLLYGTRGGMPGPQYQPCSVFEYPRGRHSAKPIEIREEIERMYPDFDQNTRLELFSRDAAPGWTARGYEAS